MHFKGTEGHKERGRGEKAQDEGKTERERGTWRSEMSLRGELASDAASETEAVLQSIRYCRPVLRGRSDPSQGRPSAPRYSIRFPGVDGLSYSSGAQNRFQYACIYFLDSPRVRSEV